MAADVGGEVQFGEKKNWMALFDEENKKPFESNILNCWIQNSVST